MSSESGQRPREARSSARKSDRFYWFMVFLGRQVYRICTHSVELNGERTAQPGGTLLVSNHVGPYDVPCLMKVSQRPLDFISLGRFGDMKFVGWLFRNLNVMFLRREDDLGDSPTFKQAAKRLRKGKVVVIFPEGEMRKPGTEASRTGNYSEGFGQLAVLGRAKILPAVVLDSNNLSHWTGWLPWPKTTWGVNIGEPIPIPTDCDSKAAAERMERLWLESITALEKELRLALDAEFQGD